MKPLRWAGLCAVIFLAAGCSGTANYGAVRGNAQNAQQALDQAVQNHP